MSQGSSAGAVAPPEGAYIALSALVGTRFAASQLVLSRRNRALAQLAGPIKSNFRGRGIDFEEVRRYQPGDDIRGIDWRVTARSGAAHTKLFREERERPALIVIDQRSSMFFGSRNCTKSVLAAYSAALVGWSALAQGDRVGSLVFGDHSHRDVRPRRSRKALLRSLSDIALFNNALPGDPGSENNTHAALDNLRRVARPGSSIYLISDFAGFQGQDAAERLYQLSRHCEITALHCSDPLEAELPPSGHYAVSNGEQRLSLNTGNRQLQAAYRQQYETRLDALTTQLRKLGIPLIAMSTADSPLAPLQRYFGRAT